MGQETEHFTAGNQRPVISYRGWNILLLWDILLQARALENISYVCGVNRIGTDGNQMLYNGGSVIYSPKGDLLASVPDHEEGTATATLDLSVLREFRQKFPAWKDAECFQIKN